MKKLIAVMLFLALGVAHANSNVSIAITVGQWLLKNQTRSFYIQVEAQGVNDSEARHNGFVLAVDQAVGTLILSERESDKKQLIKNDVYNYSSGYVTDYKILSKSTRGNNSVMVMDVWVSHSAIANRILGRSAVAGQLNGPVASARVETLLTERASGDQVVSRVLADFPRRAFDITLGATVLRMDEYRQALIEIPFSMKWNYSYITSLHEVLQAASQNPQARNCWNHNQNCANQTYIRVVAQDPNRWAKWQNTLGFNDYQKLHLVNDTFIGSTPVMQLIMRDSERRVIKRDCYRWQDLNWTNSHPYTPGISFAEWRNNQTSINGDLVRDSRIVVSLGQNTQALAAVQHIELSVIKSSQCTA
jgi:hypothetical protein